MVDTLSRIYGDYSALLRDVSSTAYAYMQESEANYSYPWDFVRDLRRFTRISQRDVFVGLGMACLFAVFRMALTSLIFVPLSNWFKLTKGNREKFPESAWKFSYYSVTWTYSAYLLFYPGKYDFFFNPNNIWKDWTAGMEIPMDICVLYMIQFGFYLHSLYATLYLDHWRKDSHVMLFHHVVSCLLLIFSYATRYYKIAVLVLFMHDIADIFLEFTKCNVYMKNRGGKHHAFNDHIATAGFLCFASVWYWFRLYWYPVKVIYSAAHASRQDPTGGVHLPFYLIFNVLLCVILLLNLYWWLFILNFLYRVATGQMKEVDDIREEEILEKHNHQLNHQANGKINHQVMTNGTSSKAKKKQ